MTEYLKTEELAHSKTIRHLKRICFYEMCNDKMSKYTDLQKFVKAQFRVIHS